MLKLLQRLVLDFPYIFFCNFSRAFLTAKCIDSVLGLLAHARPCNALTFFNRILWREALVYNSFFFSEYPLYGNYSTLGFHTNTVIS